MPKCKTLAETLHTLKSKFNQAAFVSRDAIFCALEEAIRSKDPVSIRQVHFFLIWSCLDTIPVLANHLIRAFVSIGSLIEASQVFAKVQNPTVHTWNAIINGYLKLGECELSVGLYHLMLEDGYMPDKVTFSCLIKACCDEGMLQLGKQIHDNVLRDKTQFDLVVGNALIDMYSRHGCLEDAHHVFESMPYKDEVSWTSLLLAYAEHGEATQGLWLYEQMPKHDVLPDRAIHLGALKCCGTGQCLLGSRYLHDQIVRRGLDSDLLVATTIVDTYSKCGSILEAHCVFNRMPNKNLVTWVALIAGYAMHGSTRNALKLFEDMQLEGINPNKDTLLLILGLCGSIQALEQGMLINGIFTKLGSDSDIPVCNSLVEMYARCGRLDEACIIFAGLLIPEERVCSTLVMSSIQHSQPIHVINLLEKMLQNGLMPNDSTLSAIIKVCGNILDVITGRIVHDKIVRNHSKLSTLNGATLINMYGTFGRSREALKVFDELIHTGICFDDLEDDSHRKSLVALMVAVIRLCHFMCSTFKGRLIHAVVLALGIDQDIVVGNALIDMYIKCEAVTEAHNVFDGLGNKDCVSWGTIIAGYVQHGHNCIALELYDSMLIEGINPNQAILSSILKACGMLENLRLGRIVHEQIVKHCLHDLVLGNTLIHMYVTNRSLDEAQKVFDGLSERDVISWCSIIEGYVDNGQMSRALQLFECMQTEGLVANNVIFLCILKACRISGSLTKGMVVHDMVIKSQNEQDNNVSMSVYEMYIQYGALMEAKNVFDKSYSDERSLGDVKNPDSEAITVISNVEQEVEHYLYMADVFSLKGLLNESSYVLQTMPTLPDTISWTGLLTNCTRYGNVEVARFSFNQVCK